MNSQLRTVFDHRTGVYRTVMWQPVNDAHRTEETLVEPRYKRIDTTEIEEENENDLRPVCQPLWIWIIAIGCVTGLVVPTLIVRAFGLMGLAVLIAIYIVALVAIFLLWTKAMGEDL